MRYSLLTIGSLLATTGVVAAQPTEPAGPAEQAAAASPSAATAAVEGDGEPQPEKKICRSSKVTGSLTRRSRICMTEAQWREVNDRTRRGMDEMTGMASGAPRCITTGAQGPMDAACGAGQ